MIKKFFLIIFIFFNFAIHCQNDDSAFIQSFVDCYDFRPEGRYAHEYHDFTRKKTAQSFLELEDRLKSEGLSLDGRICILGYEAAAIPSYYTSYKKARISDEAASLSNVGWSLQLHNKFGLMTGFLFKDLNEFKLQSIFRHINPFEVELFNDDSEIFLQHAFGEAYDLMQDYKVAVERSVKSGNPQNVLLLLKKFWQDLYTNEVKTTSGQFSATQDILFSLEYADYFLKSELPVLKYFTGPDITYPIEVSLKQQEAATKNAQSFLPILTSNLNSIEDEATVYIFDSFVDGVGKSTMLGNIKNWMNHKQDVKNYDRVDNSSSQYSELFKFKDNVYIADLPAQVSHFVYKPDGFVYVDVEAEMTIDEVENARHFARLNKEELFVDYQNLLNKRKNIISKKGYFHDSINDFNNPQNIFIKNLLLLKKDKANTWIPFDFKGRHYIFNYNDLRLRVLCPLESASSHGLKNIAAEQMLFSCVRFPFAYKIFLNDLMQKLKQKNIKRVVFVDFFSMYPRSSRENVRINYLLMQMALLNSKFNVNQSLYKDFTSGSELLADLISPGYALNIYESMQLEVELRLMLFRIINEQKIDNLVGMPLNKLTDSLKEELSKIKSNNSLSTSIDRLIGKKLDIEVDNLLSLFGRSKDFINIQQFSFDDLVKFSKIVSQIFKERVVNLRLNTLWDDLDGNVSFLKETSDGDVDKKVQLTSGAEVRAIYELPFESKNAVYLAPFFKMVRGAFYSTFANLLAGKQDSNGNLMLNEELYKVPPMLVKYGENGQVYLVQKQLDPLDDKDDVLQNPSIDTSMFYLRKKVDCGRYDGDLYCLNFDNAGTNFGVYAFGSMASRIRDSQSSAANGVVSRIVQKYQEENGVGIAMPTSVLYNRLQSSSLWKKEKDAMFGQAQKNGEFKFSHLKKYKKNKRRQRKIFKANQNQRAAARLVIRLLATLEMVVKDADADIVVRRGNKEDFVAAVKLLEEAVLPKYFGILFTKPLFDDYESVTPVLNWSNFESHFSS